MQTLVAQNDVNHSFLATIEYDLRGKLPNPAALPSKAQGKFYYKV